MQAVFEKSLLFIKKAVPLLKKWFLCEGFPFFFKKNPYDESKK